jgi:four helix bundle protein
MRGVRRFTDLRAWQACDTYRKAIYKLIDAGVYGNDWERRKQIDESSSGPADHIAEGFGRFNPPDFARFTVMARSSLMESQSQLRDAVNKRYITEETRLQLDALAVTAVEEVTGLMEYLQSPEALRNARRARERRIASRPERLANRQPRPNPEQRTSNNEQRTANPEPRTPNTEPSTPNTEPSTEPEHEPSTKNPEA